MKPLMVTILPMQMVLHVTIGLYGLAAMKGKKTEIKKKNAEKKQGKPYNSSSNSVLLFSTEPIDYGQKGNEQIA